MPVLVEAPAQDVRPIHETTNLARSIDHARYYLFAGLSAGLHGATGAAAVEVASVTMTLFAPVTFDIEPTRPLRQVPMREIDESEDTW